MARKRPFDLPPLGLIEGFEAAARNLSFTKAAQELFLTQSAVSRQIKALEERLGIPLFRRLARGLALTKEGDALYRVAGETLGRIEETTRRIRGMSGGRAFTVTTTPAFASLWLIPRLAGYTKEHPQVDVRISATNEIVNLERSGIELAIRICGPPKPKRAAKLFQEDVFPVCSPALLRDRSRPLAALQDLAHHVLLHFEDPRGAPWLDWSVWLTAVGLPGLEPSGALHFSHYDQVIAAAVNGQGIALGRSPLLKRLLSNGQLAAPFNAKSVAPRAYYIVESAAASGNPEVMHFVAWVKAEAKKDARNERATGAHSRQSMR